MRRHHAVRNAFTLVELLIVIAIIGVLIGLLMPVVSGARESAKRTQCAAHLRTLGQAMIAYGADNDRKLPIHVSPGAFLWDIGRETRDSLVKYGAERKTLYCPTVERESDDSFWNFSSWTVAGYWFLHRRLPPAGTTPPAAKDNLASPQFEFLGDPGTPDPKPYKRKLRYAFDQPRAAELELVTDATMSTGTGTARRFTGLSAANPYNQTSHLKPDKKTADGSNILFMDGRVEWRHWNDPPTGTDVAIPADQMQIRHRPPGRDIDQWF
jgi:prepilin-type N-terminal cleavage/methylation domain-containing protein/prepilin-type processing-associated H-X9-DG protein